MSRLAHLAYRDFSYSTHVERFYIFWMKHINIGELTAKQQVDSFSSYYASRKPGLEEIDGWPVVESMGFGPHDLTRATNYTQIRLSLCHCGTT
jgi:hypothetical protein